MNTLRILLACLVSTTSRHPRYFPKIEWSKESWTHNVFRVWEYLFGRKFGIRAEAAVGFYKKDGQLFVNYEFFTFEAILAHLEGRLRKGLSLIPKRIYFPRLASGLPTGSLASGVLMAVAFDAVNNSNRWGAGSSNTITVSLAVSGSDRFISNGTSTNQPVSPSTVTYNGDALSAIASKTDTDYDIWTYGLIAPDTGTNDLVVTLSGATVFVHGKAISYTGVDQTDAIGDTSTNGANSGTAITQLIDTTVANSWIVDYVTEGSDGATVSADDGQTIRENIANGIRFIVADQATTTVAQYDSDYTISASNGWVIVSFELLPTGSAAVARVHSNLLFMGVG